MTLNHEVLVLLRAIKRPLIYLPYILLPLTYLILATGQVTVNEGKARAVVVEPDSHRPFVATLPAETRLHLARSDVMYLVLVLIPCEK